MGVSLGFRIGVHGHGSPRAPAPSVFSRGRPPARTRDERRDPHAWFQPDLDDRRRAAHRRPADLHPQPRLTHRCRRRVEQRARLPPPPAPPSGRRPRTATVVRGRPARSAWSTTSAHSPVRAQRARQRGALAVGVLHDEHPARAQQRARPGPATAAGSSGRRPSRRTARRCGSWSRTSGSTRHGADGDVGRVAHHDVDLPLEVGRRRVVASPSAHDRRRGRGGPGCAAPSRAPPRPARPRAPERGHLVLDGAGRSRPSRCTGRRPRLRRLRRCRVDREPGVTSVSGRGTKTPGPTARVSRRKWARPVRCCSGTRVARSSTRPAYPSGSGVAEHHRSAHVRGVRAEGVRGELDGVDLGRGDAGRGQPRGRLAHRGAQVAHRSAIAARRAASSASTQDWTTGSRSPSSTVSRL